MKPTYRSTTEKLEQLRKDVCNYYRLTIEQFTSTNRKYRLVRARQLFYYVARYHLPNTVITDLAYMTNRDHTTVIHGLDKIRGQLKLQPEMVEQEIVDLITFIKPEESSPAWGLHPSICHAGQKATPNEFDHKSWIWQKTLNGKM